MQMVVKYLHINIATLAGKQKAEVLPEWIGSDFCQICLVFWDIFTV